MISCSLFETHWRVLAPASAEVADALKQHLAAIPKSKQQVVPVQGMDFVDDGFDDSDDSGLESIL